MGKQKYSWMAASAAELISPKPFASALAPYLGAEPMLTDLPLPARREWLAL